MLDKQGFAYEKLNAEDNAELAMKYGVKQAPTLVVTDGEQLREVRRSWRDKAVRLRAHGTMTDFTRRIYEVVRSPSRRAG